MTSSTFRNIGSDFFYSGKYEEAIQYFELSTSTYSNDYLSYFYLGLCLVKLKENEKALEYLKKALTVDNESANVFFVLGKAFYDSGKFDTEISEVKEIIKNNTTSSLLCLKNGITCIFLSQYDQAKELLNKAKIINNCDTSDYEYVLQRL